MKKVVFILAILITATLVHAQFTVRIIVTDVATKKLDDIYVAGSFNNWQPHDDASKMKLFGATRKILVLKDVPAGTLSFKFTRGAWEKVETTAEGGDVYNHEYNIGEDTTINFFIEGWQDDFPVKPKPNTASAQVHIIDTAFYMPQLNRTRRIWIYLPKNYLLLKSKLYPVIYMHDAQNLFNIQTAFKEEWGVDECLDSLQQLTGREAIVVGIDNGGDKRMTEYNPYDNDKYGKSEAAAYVDFIALTLKPYIDSHYQTLKDVSHTGIAGSSMGGLVSLYAIEKYPAVFGVGGIFSPSFWIAPQLYSDIAKVQWKQKHKLFFYAGGKEGEDMVPDMQKMNNQLGATKTFETQELIFPTGQHDETYWRKVFPTFYAFFMKQ